MAGTLTHYKIGLDVYNKINSLVDKDIYLLAIQGHDLLMFIKLRELGLFSQNKKQEKLIQTKKFNLVCNKFLDYLIKNPQDREVKSFFYGYLTHHLTDSIYHPFIHYYAHIVTKEKETKKYDGQHALLESVIDVLTYPNYPKIGQEIPKIKVSKHLEEVVENIFKEVYDVPSIGKKLVNNMANVKGFLTLYRQDKTKIKRIGYLTIQKLTGKKIEFLSFNYPKKYLQKMSLDKVMTWHHPVTGEEYHDSLNSLEDKAIKKTLEVIKDIEKNLKQGKKTEINLDISAYHGLDCNHDYKLKYFIN